MLVALIAILCLASANADDPPTSDELLPYCDLVQTSYVDIEKHDDLVDISMSWDPKMDNYAQINGNLTGYVVRHGPMEDGRVVENETVIMRVAAGDSDFDTVRPSFILANVTPTDEYFVQICAVGNSYRFLFQPNLWDHAWRGTMGLGPYKSSEPSSPVQQQQPASQFSPECDLVETSYVSVNADWATNLLSIEFSWDRKESSYRNMMKTIDHYLVRHGPLVDDGKSIAEEQARYLPLANDTIFFSLDDVSPGGSYGLQICAIDSDDYGLDAGAEWNKKAWLGTLDLSTYVRPTTDVNDTATDRPAVEDLDAEDYFNLPPSTITETPDEDVGPMEIPEASTPTIETTDDEDDGPLEIPDDGPTVIPRCDLVQQSHVTLTKVPDLEKLLLSYTWEKNQVNYDVIGPFDHYVVRHGSVDGMGMSINESNARYTIVFDDAGQFDLDEVPIGGDYGIQICAVMSDDLAFDLDKSFDWTNKARINNLYLPENEEWFNFDGTIEIAKESNTETDDGSEPQEVQDPANQDQDPDDDSSDDLLTDVEKTFTVAKITWSNNYAILLLVLAIIGVLSITIGCICLCMARKRRNAKLAEFAGDLPTKDTITALP